LKEEKIYCKNGSELLNYLYLKSSAIGVPFFCISFKILISFRNCLSAREISAIVDCISKVKNVFQKGETVLIVSCLAVAVESLFRLTFSLSCNSFKSKTLWRKKNGQLIFLKVVLLHFPSSWLFWCAWSQRGNGCHGNFAWCCHWSSSATKFLNHRTFKKAIVMDEFNQKEIIYLRWLLPYCPWFFSSFKWKEIKT